MNIPLIFKDIDDETKSLLLCEKLKPELKIILKKLKKVKDYNKLCPKQEEIFNAFRLCPIKKIKVVIIGQDPYHSFYENRPTDHGLSFSSLDKKIPASLNNIFKCLKKSNLIEEIKIKPDLSYLSKQGVLLLNSSLTTIKGEAYAHSYWSKYTDKLIEEISNKKEKIIFVLWGGYAKQKKQYINSEKEHLILEWLHPSPMAQSHVSEERKFINCDHFIKINKYLKEHNKEIINWDTKKEIKLEEINLSVLNLEEINLEEIIDNNNMEININEENIIKDYSGEFFTDGAYSSSNKTAGFGIYISKLKKYNELKISNKIKKEKFNNTEYNVTNIRAEGYGILYTLVILEQIYIKKIKNKEILLTKLNELELKPNKDYNNLELKLTKKYNKKFKIYTDSEFWINVITKWLTGWKNKNNLMDKKNQDLILNINYYYELLKKNNIFIEFEFVRAHAEKNKDIFQFSYTEKGNYIADKLATKSKNYKNNNFIFE